MGWTTIDIAARAVERLPLWARSKVRIPALIAAIGDGLQIVEDDLDDLITLRTLATATGASLAQYGALVGESAEGVTADELRALIRGRLVAGRSTGTVRDVTATALACFPDASVLLQADDLHPMTIRVCVGVPTAPGAVYLRRVRRVLEDAKPAGVRLLLAWGPSYSGAVFAFDVSGAGFTDGYFAGGF